MTQIHCECTACRWNEDDWEEEINYCTRYAINIDNDGKCSAYEKKVKGMMGSKSHHSFCL